MAILRHEPGPSGFPTGGKPNHHYATDENGNFVWVPDHDKQLFEEIDNIKENGGSGSGLPEGGGPYQQLVTGIDGVTKWEDRTHFRIAAGEAIYPEVTFITAETDGIYMATVAVARVKALVNGEELKAIVDGVEYDVTVYLDSIIGNESLTGGEDTGEPFAANLEPGAINFVSLTDTEPTQHTLRVLSTTDYIQPLLKEYATPVHVIKSNANNDTWVGTSLFSGHLNYNGVTVEEALELLKENKAVFETKDGYRYFVLNTSPSTVGNLLDFTIMSANVDAGIKVMCCSIFESGDICIQKRYKLSAT